MAGEKSEWTATDEVAPGFERNRTTGPTSSEWTVTPGKGELPSVPMTWGDAIKIGAQGGNSFLMGAGNRIIAASHALAGREGYSAALERLAEEDKQVRARHPYLSMGSEVVGGLGNAAALTSRGILGGGREGASLLAQSGRGLLEGGGLGILQGAGTTYSGIPSDYLHNAGMGAILGAGMGAVAPAVGSAAGAAYRAVADRGWRGGIPAHLAQAAQADAPGLRALPNTPGAMLPDAGPSMLGVTQGAVTEGPGSSALINNLTARNTASPVRITADIERTYPPAVVPSQVEAGVRGRMQEMGDAYQQVFSNARAVDTAPVALWIEGQIGSTAGKAQDALRRVRADLDIPTNPGVLDPHPERLHAVRSDIKGILNDPNVDGNTKRVLGQVEQRLTRELHDKVPGVRQVDDAYAELGSQERAIQTGQDSAGARMFDKSQANVYRPVQLQETLTAAAEPKGGNIGPSAEAFRLTQAGRAEIDRIIGTNKNDLLALENVLGQPQDWNAQKLGVMFGQDRADALMEVLRRERMFRDTHQKVVEGSQTARRTQAQKAQEGDEGKIPWETSILGTIGRGAQELWRSANRSSINAGRDRIAAMMAEQDPVRLQQLVDQMLAAQPTRDVRQDMAKRLIERGLAGAPALAPSITNR